MLTRSRSEGSKRRRTASPTATKPHLQITDLPDSLLLTISEYLPSTSIALFALALTTRDNNNANQLSLSDASKAIVSSHEESSWEVIDFLDVEKELREKLSDNNIRDLLISTNAIAKLKKLKLTHCSQIIGSALEPLRGSLVLEQLDLSQVGQYDYPFSNGQLSCEIVLPILESIIAKEDSSLKYIQFPEKWLSGTNCESTSTLLKAFLEKYHAFLKSKGISCAACCNEVCGDTLLSKTEGSRAYGLQLRTCYNCLDSICLGCEDDFDVDLCSQCKKVYCHECNPVVYCHMCSNQSCRGCGLVDNYCSGCDVNYCDFCDHGAESDY